MRPGSTVRALVLLACIGANPTKAASTDLVTPLEQASPRMRFHEGETRGGQPLIVPTLPRIPGAPSDWYVAQWQRDTYLHAADATERRGRNGMGWQFHEPDGQASLDIVAKPGGRGYAYELFERDGKLTAGGGSNLFLATGILPGPNDFALPIALTMDVRLTRAVLHADTPEAAATGAVQAMAFAGIGLMFIDPGTNRHRFVFMQVPITVSRETPTGPGIMCAFAAGQPQLLYAPPAARLPFHRMSTDRQLRFDLSAGVVAMIAHPYWCGSVRLTWPRAETVPANWHVTGLYVGLETQNRDERLNAGPAKPAGTASLGLELSSLTLTRAGSPVPRR